MNTIAYLWIFCALAYMESAGYVYRLHRRSDLNRISALLLLWVAAYALLLSFTVSMEAEAQAMIFTKLHIIGAAFVGPLSLHFLLVVSRHEALARKPALLAAIYVVPLLFSVYTAVDPWGAVALHHSRWGWDVVSAPDHTAWPYLYFFYACLAMAAGFIVVIARAFSTRDRLEKKQMTAIACFTVIAVVDSVIVSLYGVTGSVRTDLSDASVLSRHIVSLASLSVWLAGLRFVNWRFKLLVSLPETFAGDLLSSMGLPLFLVDRDNVITFANKEAASALGRGAAGAAKLEGTYFHDAFKNREAVLESAKKLHDRSSEHELWVGLVGPDTPVHVSMFPVIDDDDVYCGSFVMVRATGGLEEIRKRAHLTNRELEILILLDQGFKTKEISRALFISELTAKTHIHNIYQKVGARSRVELSKMVRD